jgi:hypothetical protein
MWVFAKICFLGLMRFILVIIGVNVVISP